jgi:ribose 5-phosphate isomerase B
MRVAVGCDHAGFDLKGQLLPLLEQFGEVRDAGCHAKDRTDYDRVTVDVACAVASGAADRGVLICGNGFAMAMLANRIPNVRAAVMHDSFSARTARTMGGANVAVFGARVVGAELAKDLLSIWLRAEPEAGDDGRYARRLERLGALDSALRHPDWAGRLDAYLREPPTILH